MTKRNLFINILFLIIAIIFSAISQCSSALSDKRLCYNPDCSEPVSLAKTTIKYVPNEPGLLKFDISVEVKVYSKEAGNRTDLWGVEINGKHGYVPKRFLKEYKIIHKDLHYEVPINQLSKSNKVSNKKHQSKEDNHKLVFDIKDVKASNVETDNLDLKSTEELPYNVTPSYKIIDGTTVHLDDEPFVQPTFAAEVIQATIVSNKQNAVDNLEINSSNDNNESNIFTEDAKLPQDVLNDELEVNKQSTSGKLSIKDFVASSKEIFNSPDRAKATHVPLLDTNANLKSEVENEVENLENNAPFIAKNASALEDNLDINISQTRISDKEISIELDKTVVINDTNIHAQDIEKINTFDGEDVKLSESATSLGIEQNESKAESKNIEHLSNIPPSLLGTNITGTIEAKSSFSENLEGSLKNTDEFNKKDDKLLQNDSKSQIKQSELKEESRNTKDLGKHNQSTARLKLPLNINEGDNNEGKDLKTKSDETISFVSQNSDLNINNSTNTIIVSNEENDQNLEKKQNILHDETRHNIKRITEVINKVPEADETISFASQDSDLNINKSTNIIVPNEENDQELEKKQNVLHETHYNIKEISEVINKVPEADKTISFASQDSDLNINEGTNIIVPNKENDQELEKTQNILHETHHNIKEISEVINKVPKADDNLLMTSDSTETPHLSNEIVDTEYNRGLPKQLLYSTDKEAISENVMDINEFRNRDLLNVENVEKSKELNIENVMKDEADNTNDRVKDKNDKIDNNEIQHESLNNVDALFERKPVLDNVHKIEAVSTSDICTIDNVECSTEDHQNHFILEETPQSNENTIIKGVKVEHGYWLFLIYLSVTATATLLFSLGYYYIENIRRDKQLICRINQLEKDLLIATKECTVLHENLKTTQEKLTRIEDESFGSNEMVLSLKADLEVSQNARKELEDQVAILEKDVENATEAGLELERMLREVLSSNNEVNPLAQSVEDLQARLNAQQAANDSLTNALKLKTQENESLSTKLASLKKEYEELEVELARVTDNLKLEKNSKNSLEQTLSDKVQQLEMQIKEISTEKATLQKKLKNKEAEAKDLLEVINQLNSSNLDLNKLYDVSHIKAEATALLEEKNELKIRLVEIEGAHHLLEEHMKVIKEEVATLSEQCKVAEKEKKDAETRLEVLTSFFEEKEAQRQKEEAIWLQQQGEVVSTVERIQAMQNEIQNYKQQIEMLKREVLDQEREYKNQISVLETKAHEQWVIARQVERRLEESKVEAGQLRNRLTLIEKNINDADSEAKLHRLEANGETTTSPPLFIGAESSSSPIMFSGSSSVPPPPPPSYLHSLFPPYLPPPLPNTSGVPPYEVSQRPPPLGGRLSSPPPMPLHPSVSSRYDNAGSPPPPPMSPRLLPPFNHRSPPPPPFGSDIHPPPPPPPGSILPPPLGSAHSWGEESLPPPRNSGFHPSQRVRIRNRKGSLHSSGESLDKTRHNNKV